MCKVLQGGPCGRTDSQMPQMNAPTPDAPALITIPRVQYDAFTAQINAMPKRKRKQWKAHLFDKWGGRTCCKFENNDIYNWSAEAQAWVKVAVYEDVAARIPTSRLGQMIAAGIPHDVAFEIEMQLNQTANAGEGGVVDDYGRA